MTGALIRGGVRGLPVPTRKPDIRRGIQTAQVVEAGSDSDLEPQDPEQLELEDELEALSAADAEPDEGQLDEPPAGLEEPLLALAEAALDTTLDSLDESEYEGDLEDEPEPAPEREVSDDERSSGRGELRQPEPALEILCSGRRFWVAVRPLRKAAPIRTALLDQAGHYLIEHFRPVFLTGGFREAEDRLRALARGHQQTRLLEHVVEHWPLGGASSPAKDLVTRLLKGNWARVPVLGLVRLADFFAGDRAEARRATPEALAFVKRLLASEPRLTDSQVGVRLTGALGGRWSSDRVARLRSQLDIAGRRHRR